MVRFKQYARKRTNVEQKPRKAPRIDVRELRRNNCAQPSARIDEKALGMMLKEAQADFDGLYETAQMYGQQGTDWLKWAETAVAEALHLEDNMPKSAILWIQHRLLASAVSTWPHDENTDCENPSSPVMKTIQPCFLHLTEQNLGIHLISIGTLLPYDAVISAQRNGLICKAMYSLVTVYWYGSE